MNEKTADGYQAVFDSYERLYADVLDMEENSRWTRDVRSDELSLRALYPVEVIEESGRYGIDEDIAMDTAAAGTRLLLSDGGRMIPVRETAIPTLQETAKLSGSALGRMTPDAYSRVLNEGFSTASGRSLLLERYGKVSACHSSAGGGYEIMPISRLLEISENTLCQKFGETEFMSGFNSHGSTEAWWTLNEAQDRLTGIYQKAIENSGGQCSYAINFMPAVYFRSSDTGSCCATLTPVFMMNGNRPIHFVDGIKVRHTRKGSGFCGIDEFTAKAEEIYSRFESISDTVSWLAGITVMNCENCVVSLCKRYGIAKKYGDAAREEVCRYSCGKPLSGHDVYIAMTAASAAAKNAGASALIINNIDEALGRIALLQDFSEHDVGGTVAWAS